METVLFLIVGLVLAYIIVYTSVGNILKDSQPLSNQEGGGNKLVVPEDATLKRHFFSNLQAEVEAELSPRPTCSMLRRHFDSLVSAEMEKRLLANAV